MLRTGFSSESVLTEIANRHVTETLDPVTEKTLIEYGATPELLTALKSNAYKISANETEQLQNKMRAVSRPASQTSAQMPRVAPAAPGPDESALLRGLRDKLVICRDGTIGHPDDASLEKKKLIAFYFSAHWCAPCRKFTPQLVDYYNQIEPQHPEFEIIFVSCDRSRFNWETYMRETHMPWLAIDYDQLTALGPLKQLGGSAIPSLVLLDGSGRVLSSTFEGEKYLGPQKVLSDLQQIFAKSGNPVAQAH